MWVCAAVLSFTSIISHPQVYLVTNTLFLLMVRLYFYLDLNDFYCNVIRLG